MILVSTIKQGALEVGFDLVGIAPPSAVHDLEFLPQWLKKGYGGEMRYLADPRREDLRNILPSVKSVVCVGLVYNTQHRYSSDVDGPGAAGRDLQNSASSEARPRAWVSRYAWGRDYHQIMRRMLEQLRTILNRAVPGVETRVYVDTGPVVERAFARLTGIGWMGKNTCLINESKGSWFFLGVILTNLALESGLPAADRCGSCTRCLEACPTGALVEPYVMDASRCISYFNIELKGAIPQQFRGAIGRNVFGCDICQDVCPWNNHPLSAASGPPVDDGNRGEQSSSGSSQRRTAATALPEFQPMQIELKPPPSPSPPWSQPNPGVGPIETFSLYNPSLEDLSSLSEEDFQRLFVRSPIKRIKYRGWLRNLCVAIGNSGERRFVAWLEDCAQHPDAMVREHALWALRKLQPPE